MFYVYLRLGKYRRLRATSQQNKIREILQLREQKAKVKIHLWGSSLAQSSKTQVHGQYWKRIRMFQVQVFDLLQCVVPPGRFVHTKGRRENGN